MTISTYFTLHLLQRIILRTQRTRTRVTRWDKRWFEYRQGHISYKEKAVPILTVSFIISSNVSSRYMQASPRQRPTLKKYCQQVLFLYKQSNTEVNSLSYRQSRYLLQIPYFSQYPTQWKLQSEMKVWGRGGTGTPGRLSGREMHRRQSKSPPSRKLCRLRDASHCNKLHFVHRLQIPGQIQSGREKQGYTDTMVL